MTEEQKKICRAHPYEKLYDALETGSYDALVTFIRCTEFHDGGNLEDLIVLSGLFLLKDPFVYVYILEHEDICEPCLENFFVMRHWDLVDDAEGTRKNILKKIDALKTLEPSRVRDFGIKVLEESFESWRDIESDSDGQ